jgi:hypothetical protein
MSLKRFEHAFAAANRAGPRRLPVFSAGRIGNLSVSREIAVSGDLSIGVSHPRFMPAIQCKDDKCSMLGQNW